MKKLFFYYIFFVTSHILLAQNPIISDFRISIDESEAAYIQNDVKLFSSGKDEFIVAWEDYRNGIQNFYAQRFDSLGNKVGKNFKVTSNLNITLNNSSNFLNLRKDNYSTVSPYYENYGMTITGTIYDNSNNILAGNIPLGGGSYPWCGTGWLGEGYKVSPTDDGYFYAFHFGGEMSVWNLDSRGNTKFQYSFLPSGTFWGISEVAVASVNQTHLLLWYNTDGNIKPMGLYASIFNDTGIIDTFIAISGYSIPDIFYYDNMRPSIQANIVSDSLFQIYFISPDYHYLKYVKLNTKGELVSEIDSIPLVENTTTDPNSFYHINAFDISPVNKNKFVAYLNLENYNSPPQNSDRYFHCIVFFDAEGNFINKFSEESGQNYNIIGKPFILSDHSFLTAVTEDDDAYLYHYDLYENKNKIRINDDASGSNEEKPAIISVNDEKSFVVWNNEVDNYGRFIDEFGNLLGNKITLDSKNIFFLSGDYSVSTWKNTYGTDSSVVGYTLSDGDWNIVSKDTLKSDSQYQLGIAGHKLSDSTFIVYTENSAEGKFYVIDNQGLVRDEKSIPPLSYGASSIELLPFDDTSMLLVRNNYIQKFNKDLSQITKMNYVWYNNYLGKDRFLSVEYRYEVEKSYGTILNSVGDTSIAGFDIADYSINDIHAVRINDEKFILLYNYNKESFVKVFKFDGSVENQEFKISSGNEILRRKPDLLLMNEKVVFVWEDLREGNKGFDIYGNIYDLSVITKVEETTDYLPSQYVLCQNYPNPFNPATVIKYTLSEDHFKMNVARDYSSNVTLKVYDILGRIVTTLVDKEQKPGNYEVIFDAVKYSSGIYYYQLKTGSFSKTKKMILLK